MATAKKAQPPAIGAVEDSTEDGNASGRRMSGAEFARLRASLGKSQRELAGLLGVSLKAVESYEQGWRNVPAHIERILYFLLFKLNESEIEAEASCWDSMNCPAEKREKCVAYVAKEGRFCWFFTGRLCATAKSGDADDRGCYSCSVFSRMLEKVEGGES
jgi:DNA-binding transcriptional regulator YiaG